MGIAEAATITQYLTFRLDDEVFAFDISKVREVLDMTTITRVPGMPEFMRGAINLRGSVVPVFDLRMRFGMSMTENTINTCIIIVEATADDETVIVGALADSVQEVLDLEPAQIEPAPKLGMRQRAEFITGMGKQGDGFIIMLDMDRIFSADELVQAQGLEDNASQPQAAA